MSFVVRSHPFGGLQCGACRTFLDSETDRDCKKAFREHLQRAANCKKARGKNFDGLLAPGDPGTLARRDCLAQPLSDLQAMAKYHVKWEESDPGRLAAYYGSFLKEVDFSECNSCGEVVRPENTRLHRTRKAGCSQATFASIGRLIPHYDSPDRTQNLPLDFDVLDDENFSKLYCSYISKARLQKASRPIEFRIAEGVPDPIEVAAQNLAPVMDYEPEEDSLPFRIPPASKVPASTEASNLRLITHERKEQMLVAELEKFIDDGSNTALLHFIRQSGLWALCRDYYGGNFYEMAKSLTKYSAPVDEENANECAVDSAAKLAFEVAHNQLDAANPAIRAQVMAIGSYGDAVRENRVKSIMDDISRRYSEMMSAGALGDDDDEGHLGYTSIADFLQGEAHLIVEVMEAHGNSNRVTGFDKPMDRLAASSLAKYIATFRKLMLFAFRIFREQRDEELAQYNDVLATVPHGWNSPLAKSRALQFVRQLFLRILELDDNSSTSSLVGNSHSIPSLFVRAMALDSTGLGNQKGLIRVNSPAKVHAAAAHVMYAARSMFMLELVSAVQEGDSERSKALGGPERLTKSPTMIDLAVSCAIAKAAEKRMETGTPPAVPSRSNESLPQCDTFSIYDPKTLREIVVTQSMMQGSNRTIVANSHDCYSGLIKYLPSTVILKGERTDDRSVVDLPLADPRVRDALQVGLLGKPLEIVPAGKVPFYKSSHENDHKRDASDNVIVNTNEVSSSSFTGNVYVTHDFDNDYDVEVRVPLRQLAEEFAKLLAVDNDFREFFNSNIRLRLIDLVTLLQQTMRGAPRTNEFLNVRVGKGNHSTTYEAEADMTVAPAFGAEFHTQLLLAVASSKYPGWNSAPGSTAVLSLPIELSRLVVLFMNFFRWPFIIHVNSNPDLIAPNAIPRRLANRLKTIGDLHSLVTRFVLDVYVGEEYVSVTEFDGLSKAVAANRGKSMLVTGLDGNNYRKLQVAMSVVACPDVTVGTHKLATLAFNHSVPTHKMSYLETRTDGQFLLSIPEVQLAMLLDMQAGIYLGIEGFGLRPGDVTLTASKSVLRKPQTLDGWRRFRQLSPSEALGVIKFAGSLDYQQRGDDQRWLVAESCSGARDTTMVYPCGTGKTAAHYALPGYALACVLANTAEDQQHSKLLEFLAIRPSSNGGSLEDLANKMLSDTDVKALLKLAKTDKFPPPASLLNFIIVPYRATRQSLVSDLNNTNLIAALNWSSDTFEMGAQAIKDAIQLSKGSPFHPGKCQVLVLTASFAVSERVQALIEEANMNGVVGYNGLDECHHAITTLEYSIEYTRFRQIRRGPTPILCLTGTLQNSLTVALSRCIGSLECYNRSCTRTAVSRCLPSLEFSDPEKVLEDKETYRLSNGLWRSKTTVPAHLAHAVLAVDKIEPSRAFLAQLHGFAESMSGKSFGGTDGRVLILCGARGMAEKLYAHIKRQKKEVAILLGQMASSEIETFHKKWTHGTTKLGIATTSGTVSLNNVNCDIVIHVNLLFGMQVYMQGANRAGRKGQRSLSIFMYETGTTFQSSLAVNDELTARDLSYQAMGIDTTNPDFAEAISVGAMKKFVYREPGAESCRRMRLGHIMDGEGFAAPEGDIVSIEGQEWKWCCDQCSPILSGLIRTTWDQCAPAETGPLPAFSPRSPIGQPMRQPFVRAPPRLLFQERETEADAARRKVSKELKDLEDFLSLQSTSTTMSHLPHSKCCIWHPGKVLHKGISDKVWGLGACKQGFLKFISDGSRDGPFCFKCGDAWGPRHGLYCPFAFPRSDDTCNTCKVHRSVRPCVPEKCPNDRIFGPILWGMRSEVGHKATKAEFDRIRGEALLEHPLLQYPARLPLGAPFTRENIALVREYAALLHSAEASKFFLRALLSALKAENKW